MKMTLDDMTNQILQEQFTAKVSKMGSRLYINIPLGLKSNLSRLHGQYVNVVLMVNDK